MEDQTITWVMLSLQPDVMFDSELNNYLNAQGYQLCTSYHDLMKKIIYLDQFTQKNLLSLNLTKYQNIL